MNLVPIFKDVSYKMLNWLHSYYGYKKKKVYTFLFQKRNHHYLPFDMHF